MRFVCVVAAAVAGACMAAGQSEFTGTLVLPDKSALPEAAMVTLTLEMVQPPLTPQIVSSVRFRAGGLQSPIRFRAPYAPGLVKKGTTFSMTVKVEHRGRLLYTTSKPVAMNPAKASGNTITLSRPPLDGLVGGRLQLTQINGKEISADFRIPELELSQTGEIYGNTGINSFGGKFQLVGRTLKIEVIGMTKMAGSPGAMQLERDFLEALKRVTSVRSTSQGWEMLAGAEVVLRFGPG